MKTSMHSLEYSQSFWTSVMYNYVVEGEKLCHDFIFNLI